MKTIRAKLILLTLAFLLASATESHAYDFEVDGVYYNILSLSDFTCTVTSGDYHYGREVVIPSTVTYKSKEVTVVAIDSAAFAGSTDMMSIVIPHTVAKIGNKAFKGCTGLKKVVIEDGNSVLQIGYNNYSSSAEGQGLFYECAIESLYIGRNLSYNVKKDYGYSPFYENKNLKEVTFGNTVSSVPAYIFYYCSNLTNVRLSNSIFEIGAWAFVYCTSLKEIDIPEGVYSINRKAFFLCYNLKRVTIPSTVRRIDLKAFADCTRLTSISIPDSVTYINYGAFSGCASLTSIIIPNTITTIRYDTFYGCTSLRDVYIPNSVQNIEDCAFSGCSNLANFSLPHSITSIGRGAFGGCSSITDTTIPNSVTYLGTGAFNSTSSITIEDGENVLELGYGCFQNGLSENMYIGRTLLYRKDTVNLNSSPFYGNKYLKHVTLGGFFTTIDEYMFCECDALESITSLHITPPTLGDNNFTVKQYVNVQLRVPQEAISAYQSADNWKNFWDVQPIESSGIEISKAIPTSHPTKIYDIFGRKLSNPQKGVNIINGKKILIK